MSWHNETATVAVAGMNRPDEVPPMRMFEAAHSYKTAKNAEAHLVNTIGAENAKTMRYAIIVNSAGRFVPMVVLDPTEHWMARRLADHRIAVAG